MRFDEFFRSFYFKVLLTFISTVLGATIGCCAEYCKENYHFSCGQDHNISFKEDKTVFCLKHKYFIGGDQREFKSARTLTIDNDNEKKKRPISRDLRLAQLQIGSLKIHNLGYFDKNMNFDTKQALIPVNFICSRQFWSTLDPLKKVTYTCRTILVKKEQKVQDLHLVIDHSQTEPKTAEESLQDLKLQMNKIEAEKSQKLVKNSQIIPPFAVSSLWPNLTYKDLHTEPQAKKVTQKIIKKRQNGPIFSTPKKSGTTTPTTPSRSLNKAVSNVLFRSPNKLLDVIQNEFPDLDLNNFTDKNDNEVEIIQTWYNQITKMKVTEIAIQCNLPYTRTNMEIDDLYEKSQNSVDSDCESYYEDEDMLSYVIDNLHTNQDQDLDIIQKILDLPTGSAGVEDFQLPNVIEEEIENNNDETCLSMESSPDKYANTLPDPLENIAQFDGNDDQDESPKKDFTIGKKLHFGFISDFMRIQFIS